MLRLLLLLACLVPVTVQAQNHQTFQIARPVATGTAGTGLHASNRIYRAYQGITYSIHADAVGGSWPYTYSLSNAPSGMTIEAGPCTTIGPTCTAGTITWVDPQTDASNITVRITDKDGDYVEGTWSIDVMTTIGADGFCFIDGDNSSGGRNGSLANPYNSLLEAVPGCGARSILYFRAAATAYTIDASLEDGTNPGDCGRRVNISESSVGVIWLAYPGESPVIDFESTGDVQPCFNTQGSNIWIDGIELKNVGSIGFRFNVRTSGYGAVVRNVYGHDLMAGCDGCNSSFFLWSRCDTCPSWFDTVQGSRFESMSTSSCALKWYGSTYSITDTSAFATSVDTEAVIAIKGTMPHYTVRANTCAADVVTCIGGNMDTAMPLSGTAEITGGEIYHNFSQSTSTGNGQGNLTLVYAKIDHCSADGLPTGTATECPAGTQFSAQEEVWVYRNTFLGSVVFANADPVGEGPYNFNDNVILNAINQGGSCPQYITCYSVTDYTVLVDGGDNVKGANNGSIANATTGALVGSYRTTYLGVAGYELVALSASVISGGSRFTGSVRIQ